MGAILNKIKDIVHWRYDITNAFYIISEADAQPLATQFRELVGDKGRFIITEISSNYFGWLTTESWYLIKNKQHKPKTPEAT